MKLIATLSFLTLFTLPGVCQSAPSISGLGWLAGCWEINEPSKNLLVTEQWMKPLGGSMIGMARTVRNGKTTVYEFTRIIENDKGIFYVAKPSQNTAETFFKLIKSASKEAIFEDPTHDFPQRVIYRREGNKLNARIEGNNNGKFTGIDYPFVKVACE